MSVTAYIGRDPGELRMTLEVPDPVGMRADGPVLSGSRSVEEEKEREAIRTMRRRDGYYRSVDDYDPVLRSHCRL